MALRRFISNEDGVAALEFALIVPILVLIYLTGLETMNYLDAKRSVTNASFSLAQGAAARDLVDKDGRDRFLQGHELSFEGRSLTNVKAGLTSLIREPGGAISEDWNWSLTQAAPEMSMSDVESQVQSTLVDKEGILVAIVEAEYQPIFNGLVPSFTFTGFHAKVPLKKTVAIYRN